MGEEEYRAYVAELEKKVRDDALTIDRMTQQLAAIRRWYRGRAGELAKVETLADEERQ